MQKYLYGTLGLAIVAFLYFLPPLNLGESLMFISFHLLGDVFMIYAIKEITSGRIKTGFNYNLFGSLVFMSVGILSGYLHGDWAYLLPSILFIPLALSLISFKGEVPLKLKICLGVVGAGLFGYLQTGYEIETFKILFVLLFAYPFLLNGVKREVLGLIATLGMSFVGLYSVYVAYPLINGADLTYGLFPLIVSFEFGVALLKRIKSK